MSQNRNAVASGWLGGTCVSGEESPSYHTSDYHYLNGEHLAHVRLAPTEVSDPHQPDATAYGSDWKTMRVGWESKVSQNRNAVASGWLGALTRVVKNYSRITRVIVTYLNGEHLAHVRLVPTEVSDPHQPDATAYGSDWKQCGLDGNQTTDH